MTSLISTRHKSERELLQIIKKIVVDLIFEHSTERSNTDTDYVSSTEEVILFMDKESFIPAGQSFPN
ncbi:hypothetical protein PAAL66ix_08726 [Paenibacillus alvei A6-6i-x]|nr:hypothetical protein PAAL66ix_08726 [Paenibacillus alvei A6-6i-x]